MKKTNTWLIICSLLIFLATATSALAATGQVEVLVVGGGGGAGGAISGGGGAGEYYYDASFTISDINYTVTVGTGADGTSSQGVNGEDSIFSTITAVGGGGSGYYTGSGSNGNSGASGGAGAGGEGGAGTGGAGTAGYDGGDGYTGSSPWISGGGGGASEVGEDATSTNAGDGGDGVANSISGTSTYYAGGGGGGSLSGVAGTGGLGGGGNGTEGNGAGFGGGNATDGTGGGGGGAGNGAVGGNGGDGIVIIAYPTGNVNATGGTITTSGANTIHTFTANGTFNVTSFAGPSINNLSTIGTGAFSFDTPVSIGSSYGVVNSITYDNTETESSPFYWSSSFTTNSTVSTTADCIIDVDGTIVASGTRSLSANNLGNFKLISSPLNLTYGNHTITTQCKKTGGANYEVTNSQMTQFHLHDALENTTINYKTLNSTASFGITTSDTLLSSFSFTTSNITNTTNLNDVVVHGRATYNYDQTGDITTYLKIQETGEICGNYTRGGSAGTSGSVGTTCLFKDLNDSTTYNFSFYGFSSGGTTSGSVNELLMNVYNLELNATASNTTTLNKIIPAATNTTIATINISNVLGGTFNVFVDSGVMVNSNISQDAYFWLENTGSSINYYRTLPSTSSNGNINGQYVFSESGTGTHTYNLMAYCPSGCNVSQGDLTAFITDASSVSTGLFTITAYNVYNDTIINSFNATIGGSTLSTTNGSISIISEGSINVLVEAPLFLSNTTLHDTTTNLNASMVKYVEFRANNVGGGAINNFTVNTSSDTYTTTNGVAYLPISVANTSVTFNSPVHAGVTENVSVVQYYNFTAYAENSLLITFRDSETDLVISNVSMDYFSSLDSGQVNTSNGSVYLTLLQPVAYTFRINSTDYEDNLFFTTVTNDTFEALTVYLNPNATTTTITVEIVDGGASPVSNAQVKALKYYVIDNTYRVVASGVTNPDGETNIDIVTGTNFYKFVVVYNGETVKTTDPFIITGTTVRIQVLIGEDILEDYDTWRSITSTMVFNEGTNSFRFDFTDQDSVNREVCMNVYQAGFSSDTLLNTSCVTGTSGTLLTSVTNTTGITYYAIATTQINGESFILGSESYTFKNRSIGSAGLLFQIFLTLVLSLSGFIAIELIFIMAPLSIVMGGLAGLHNISLGVTVPLVIIGIILMFLLRRNS